VFTTDERLVGVAKIEDGSLRPCKIFDPALLRH
jgi:hypothetical protein